MYNGRNSVSFSNADRSRNRQGYEPQRSFSFQQQAYYQNTTYDPSLQESIDFQQQNQYQVPINQQYHNRYPDYSSNTANNSLSTIQNQQSFRRQPNLQKNLNKIPELEDESSYISMKYLMSPLSWLRIAQIVKFLY